MSNSDQFRREVSGSELEQIKAKYPEMVQKFDEIKKEANEPQIERLGETKGAQKQRTQS